MVFIHINWSVYKIAKEMSNGNYEELGKVNFDFLRKFTQRCMRRLRKRGTSNETNVEVLCRYVTNIKKRSTRMAAKQFNISNVTILRF